jgi:hypothetical protein
VRRSRLRFQLEQNAASTWDVAEIGTTGLVDVEVAACPCRAKDVAVGAEGKRVVRRNGSVGPTQEGIQNRLRPGAVGTGRQLVDNATAPTRVFRAHEARAATAVGHAVEIPRGTQGQTV